MKSNGKFTYTRYDYSFLRPKPSWFEAKVLPIAEKVYAKTIGADLTTVQPMNEPVGQLYWIDPTFTTATGVVSNDTTTVSNNVITYEPIRDGGWEVKLTPPPSVKYTDSIPSKTGTRYNFDTTDFIRRINEASNIISNKTSKGKSNYVVGGDAVSAMLASRAEKNKDRNEKKHLVADLLSRCKLK